MKSRMSVSRCCCGSPGDPCDPLISFDRIPYSGSVSLISTIPSFGYYHRESRFSPVLAMNGTIKPCRIRLTWNFDYNFSGFAASRTTFRFGFFNDWSSPGGVEDPSVPHLSGTPAGEVIRRRWDSNGITGTPDAYSGSLENTLHGWSQTTTEWFYASSNTTTIQPITSGFQPGYCQPLLATWYIEHQNLAVASNIITTTINYTLERIGLGPFEYPTPWAKSYGSFSPTPLGYDWYLGTALGGASITPYLTNFNPVHFQVIEGALHPQWTLNSSSGILSTPVLPYSGPATGTTRIRATRADGSFIDSKLYTWAY